MTLITQACFEYLNRSMEQCCIISAQPLPEAGVHQVMKIKHPLQLIARHARKHGVDVWWVSEIAPNHFSFYIKGNIEGMITALPVAFFADVAKALDIPLANVVVRHLKAIGGISEINCEMSRRQKPDPKSWSADPHLDGLSYRRKKVILMSKRGRTLHGYEEVAL